MLAAVARRSLGVAPCLGLPLQITRSGLWAQKKIESPMQSITPFIEVDSLFKDKRPVSNSSESTFTNSRDQLHAQTLRAT